MCLSKIVNLSHRYLQNGWMWNIIINNQNTLNNGICIVLTSQRLTISNKMCLLVTVYLGCYLLCLWSLSSKVENAIDFENAQLNRMWQLGLASISVSMCSVKHANMDETRIFQSTNCADGASNAKVTEIWHRN